MEVKPHKRFEGIFWVGKKLATINLTPGYRSFSEELIKIANLEYRVWDFYTSKPAAAIKKGIKILPFEKGMKILYLGLAEAKTASFLSDIIEKDGIIYGVEISERSLREAIDVCEKRGNVVPILADARKTEEYENLVEPVDLIYEDVADPDQIKILVRNCEKFLKPSGYAIIAIKSQSIDALKPPKQVYRECLAGLEKHFKVLDKVELDPYQKAHLFVVLRAK